jgi:hypothetical protein
MLEFGNEQNRKTGRTHVDTELLEKTKEYMRSRKQEGVRAIEISEHIGCSQSMALRVLDLLSIGTDFLVYMDDEKKPMHYYIAKDVGSHKTISR